MIKIRPQAERGQTRTPWLKSLHSFHFGGFQDPVLPFNHGAGPLRVINEDWIEPSQGFGTHGHENMEIVTLVLAGTLSHKDSMNNMRTIEAGEVQRMSAGTGITHSEFNASDTDQVHLFQIWILPEMPNLEPSYEQQSFATPILNAAPQLLISPQGEQNSLKIHQRVRFLNASFDQPYSHTLSPKHDTWIQIARGNTDLNGVSLNTGDGAWITDTESLIFTPNETTDLLMIEWPTS